MLRRVCCRPQLQRLTTLTSVACPLQKQPLLQTDAISPDTCRLANPHKLHLHHHHHPRFLSQISPNRFPQSGIGRSLTTVLPQSHPQVPPPCTNPRKSASSHCSQHSISIRLFKTMSPDRHVLPDFNVPDPEPEDKGNDESDMPPPGTYYFYFLRLSDTIDLRLLPSTP